MPAAEDPCGAGMKAAADAKMEGEVLSCAVVDTAARLRLNRAGSFSNACACVCRPQAAVRRGCAAQGVQVPRLAYLLLRRGL